MKYSGAFCSYRKRNDKPFKSTKCHTHLLKDMCKLKDHHFTHMISLFLITKPQEEDQVIRSVLQPAWLAYGHVMKCIAMAPSESGTFWLKAYILAVQSHTMFTQMHIPLYSVGLTPPSKCIQDCSPSYYRPLILLGTISKFNSVFVNCMFVQYICAS